MMFNLCKEKSFKFLTWKKSLLALEHCLDAGSSVFAKYSYCIQYTANHCSFHLSVLWVLVFLKSSVVFLLLNSDSKHPFCRNVI